MDADRFALGAAAKPMEHDLVDAGVTPAQVLNKTPSSDDEKLDYEKVSGDDKVATGHTVAVTDINLEKPYVVGDPLPEDPNLPLETQQLTARAVIVGCAIGAIVQASNMYLGLKTGFTFGPQLLGGIGGFLVLKPLSRWLPKQLPKWVGVGYFGPKENVCCQTAATAAGGLGILFVSGFPAMYQLGLLSALPQDDFGKLIGFMFCTAFYGMAFAIPFRKFYVLRQKLTFPTPQATAFAIRALHAAQGGAEDARRKAKWLGYTFLVSITQKVASSWAPGILYDMHIFHYIAQWGGTSAQYVDNWGWYFEITPAFFGAGILAGLNPSLSFYGGSILAWAIIGPSLVATGRAVGVDTSEGYDLPYRSYYSMSPKQPASVNTSPRYNLLWIGVLVMVVAAFVEIGCQWRAFAKGATPFVYGIRNRFRARKGQPLLHDDTMDELVDPAGPKEQVPLYVWAPLLVATIILTCLVMGLVFDVNVGLTILSILLGFVFSAMGVLGAGHTDVNPVSSVAKASQLVVGGATHGKYSEYLNPVTGHNNKVLSINLFAGLLSAGAAAQTTDMTSDMKTGHLLRAAPITQFWAQFAGAFCSIFLSTGFFILFTTAAPCILDAGAETCAYGVPSAAAWRSVAVAITSTEGLPVPTTAGILAIVLSVVSAIMIISRETWVPLKYKGWVPNPAAAGLAFVLPQTQYGLAMSIGAIGAYIWRRKKPVHFESVGFSFAAGMVAGEGLGGVVQAILIIAGAVTDYASPVGCPQDSC